MSIVVFGSINMDLVVQCPHLPRPGETLLGDGFLIAPGGKGANQAVACARLARQGTKTYMVGRVGADTFGTTLRQSLEANGVITSGIIEDNTRPTGVALITVETSGENTIVVAPGANSNVNRDDIARMSPSLAGASVLLLQLEIPLDAVIAAAKAAQERGVTVILDPAPAQDLPTELFAIADIITPNENEAARLVGFSLESNVDVERAARILLGRGARNVVIKLGNRGAYLLNKDGGVLWPAAKVEMVDTVAAGDAFNGGLATALSEGCAIHDAMKWGIATGGLAVTKVRAQPAMPDRKSVLDLISTMT